MATYKQAFTPNEMDRNRSLVFLPFRQPNNRLSIYFQRINIVHKNI